MLNFQGENKLHFGPVWQLLNVFKAKLGNTFNKRLYYF